MTKFTLHPILMMACALAPTLAVEVGMFCVVEVPPDVTVVTVTSWSVMLAEIVSLDDLAAIVTALIRSIPGVRRIVL